MGDDEFVIPRKEDILFASNRAAWHMDAMLDYRSGDDYAYRQGYRRAGRILTEYASERREVDFLVYPICHAYRHYVELSLKGLIAHGCRVVGREMSESELKLCTTSHNLRALWDAFKIVEEEVSEGTGSETPPLEQLEGIDAYIDQLHAVDAASFSFRYALTKKGDVALGTIERINLGQFSDHMEGLCNYLEGWGSYYADLIQATHDMYSDFGDPMFGDSGD